MKHPEWLGNDKLILKLLKKAKLSGDDLSIRKQAMRCIVIYKYTEYMTTDEILSRLGYRHNIYISERTYYRLLRQAVDLMEKFLA